MQILIPIAAGSPFFKAEDYFFPKPLIEIEGRTMIEHVVAPLRSARPDAQFIFMVAQDDVARFSLDRTLHLVAGDEAIVLPLAYPTQGALCTALLSIDRLDLDQPLLICNGDQVIDADIASILGNFQEGGAAAGVITFRSVHPRWSYVRVDEKGDVLEAAEKRVIAENAIAGFYWFRTAHQFVEAAQATIMADDNVNGQFFIAPSLNQLVLKGARVTRHEIAPSAYHSFYSPSKIQEFVDRRIKQSIRHSCEREIATLRPLVVVPAAGAGRRFAEARWTKPKPFIELSGKPMIQHVVDNVAPPDTDILLLVRDEHMSSCEADLAQLRRRGCKIHEVRDLTEGTACTVLLARREIDHDRPLLIANSDQLVDFSAADFMQDCLDRDLDGSILVFRDAKRDPKWSFARLDDMNLVTEVAEKKPISDLATVGIYFFRRGRDFVDAAVDMISRNERVNGEFYTCPVYNYMIAAGKRIGVYEISPKAMHGLGTPEDFEIYRQEIGAKASADTPAKVGKAS